MGGGGEEAKRTYGFYHETASAFHPKRSCGRIVRSLATHRSSTVYQASSVRLSVGDDGQPRFRGGRDAWITFRFGFGKFDWMGAQLWKRINGDRRLIL